MDKTGKDAGGRTASEERTARPLEWAVAGLALLGVAGFALALTMGWSAAATGFATLVPLTGATALAWRVMSRGRAERAVIFARAERALRLADQDALTGVGNYRAFWRALRAECARAERHGGAFTLAVIDLDDFKSVNDMHGHLMGDEILRAVAAALGDAVRAEDVLCRQGGDEFAVVAVAAGEREASPLAARLAAAVAAADVGSLVEWRPHASVGTATYGRAGIRAEELMETAEGSLAAAKSAHHGGAGGIVPAVRPAGVGPARAASHAASARPAARLSTLASLARALIVARDEAGVAETTVAHVAGAVDARTVAVIRWAQPGGGVECLAFGGPPGEPTPAPAEDQPPLSDALREGRAALWTSPLALRGSGVPDAGPPASGTRLAAPVLVDEEVWGAILVESELDGAYDSADAALVEAMADQLGRSLSVSRLLGRLSAAGWDEENGSAVAPTDSHGRAVAELTTRVGETMEMTPSDLRDLHVAALFHEVGTVCAPAGLMEKRGHLTPEEFDVVRGHPLVGERLLGSLTGLAPAARIVRSERERFDGLGYPDGLAGRAIPLPSRILGACDAFVAMTSRRPYRPALSDSAAQAELRRGAGSQFDPDVVVALVGALERVEVTSP